MGFDYGTTANNGNVLSQTIGREGMSGTLTQYYRYDGANRLGLASEGGTAPASANGCPTTAAWCRDYSYDAYGNRAVTGVRGHTLPAAVSAFSTATNRMTAGSYDGAGNLTSLTGVGRLGYDAENRLKTYDNAVASLQEQGTYFYDGLGQRVKRQANIRGTSETTAYVYDAFGQLAAESGGTFYRAEYPMGSTPHSAALSFVRLICDFGMDDHAFQPPIHARSPRVENGLAARRLLGLARNRA